MPEMELNISYLIHAPAGVPALAVEKLNKACAAGLTQPELRQKFLTAGMQAWDGPNTRDGTRRIVKDGLQRFKRFSERTGIKLQGS